MFSLHLSATCIPAPCLILPSISIIESNAYVLPALLCVRQDSPVRFTRVLCSSPKGALQKARGVVEMYVVLLRQRASPVDWSCQEEYAALEDEEEEGEEEPPASTTPTEAVATGMGTHLKQKAIQNTTHDHTLSYTDTKLNKKHVKYKSYTIAVGHVQCILTCFGCISFPFLVSPLLHQSFPFSQVSLNANALAHGSLRPPLRPPLWLTARVHRHSLHQTKPQLPCLLVSTIIYITWPQHCLQGLSTKIL